MATKGTRRAEDARFWDVAEPLLASGRLVEGTMMGHQCLRAAAGNGFVATVERSSGDLVVKLPKARVAELIESGEGRAFAPAGKVFSEWVAVAPNPADSEASDAHWEALIEESMEFVGG